MARRAQKSKSITTIRTGGRLSRFTLFLLVVIALGAGSTELAVADAPSRDRIVRFGVYENQPKVFTNEEGHPSGLFVELFAEIARQEGWKPEYVPCAWSECLLALGEGRIDLMPDVAYSPERDEKFDFHRVPVVESWSRLYANAHHPIVALSEIGGLRVAVMGGSIQQAEFEQMMRGFDIDTIIVPTASLEEAFALARDGKVDLAIANHFFGDYFCREYGLIKTPIVFQMTELYFASAQGRNAELLGVVDRHLETWRNEPNSPYYTELARWMERPPERFLPPYIAWIIGIILGLLTVAGAMIGLLRRQVEKRTRHLWWANEQLRQSEEQYRHLFESMAQGVIYRSVDGDVIAANPAAERILGLSLDEMRTHIPGDPRWQYLREDGTEFPGDEHPAIAALRSKQPVLGTLMGVFHPSENRHRWVLVDAIPDFRPGESAPYRVYTTFTDITEHRNAETALAERAAELNAALVGAISAMSLTVEKRDPYTSGHQIRVAKLARAIAERLGLPKEEVEAIYLAGVIHDIGKISIPAEILVKPGELSSEERLLIRQHPLTGYEILKPIRFPWPIAEMVHQHHERMDGSGYPRGLAGEDILLGARIIAVADVVETMTLRRPYREALGLRAALEEVGERNSHLFDRAVVDACRALLANGAVSFFG
ncbi:MAG: transporter substrate-binding domain-containing protein [Deltaproteobacteria bacterium]|nr:transporter substrate-binding domain-containing protein [Deltaproteobacteria bacterium]